GFDIAFDQKTSHAVFAKAIRRLANLTSKDMESIRNALTNVSKNETDKFMAALQATLERFIVHVILIPLYGTEAKFTTVAEAITQLGKINSTKPTGMLHKIEIIVDYNNKDSIRASFANQSAAQDFLKKLAT
ncbi:MAG TPA: hypothetical protein VGC12_03030, partial [Methyloradius sp.]